MKRTESDLRHLALVAEHVVDPRVGVLHSLSPLDLPAGSPPFFHFTAQLANLQACGWPGNPSPVECTGADRTRAAVQALTEALALYAAACFHPTELPLARAEEAPWPCAPPESFALFSAAQYGTPGFPYRPFTSGSEVRWIQALRPRTGETCHVPAAAVRLPYPPPRDGREQAIRPPSAAGLACDCRPAAAEAAALCSLIRDDALAIAWHARLSPAQIRIETLSDECYELVERFEMSGGHLTAFDLTFDLGVPVILLALRHEAPDAPALVFAAAADPEPEEALRAALEELPLVLRHAREIKTHLRGRVADIRGSIEHLLFWSDHTNVPRADFLFASPERLELDEIRGMAGTGAPGGIEAARDRLVARIEEAGYRALLADLTSTDLEGLGARVVRAVVPGLVPLFAGSDRQALGGRRLAEIPALLGLRRGDTAGEPLLHPFLVKGIAA